MEIRKRGEQNRVSPKHEKRLIERRSIRTVDNFALESEIKTDIPKIVDYGDDIIIFVTTNKEQKLTDKEILQELISYM